MPNQPRAPGDVKRSDQRGRSPYRGAPFGNTCVRALRFEPLEERYLLSATPGNDALQVYSASPALFVENQGQWQNDAVHYRFQGPGLDIAFTDEGLTYLLMQREAASESGAAGEDALTATADPGRDLELNSITHATQFSVSFGGANAVTPVGLDEAVTKFNYLIGDQANWREGVSGFATVAYQNLYDGIDLHTFGSRDSLKYEFHVAPGADWQQIRIHYDGIEGISIDEAGALHIRTELGELIDTAPYIYQQINGQQIEIAGSFILFDDDSYAFEIQGNYDPSVALVIDPYVQWSTYLGGPPSDYGNDVVTDASGEILVTGYATATDNWVSGGYDTSFGGGHDAYVAKLSATGQHLWSTYLGGTGQDQGNAIAVNAAGEIFVTGQMYSTGWASGGFDLTNGGESDVFVVKLSTSGGHVWSTYMGGSAIDYGSGIAIDSAGNVLITGQSAIAGTWVVGGGDTSFNGGLWDAFAAKLSPAGARLWITYIGGDHDDFGQEVAVDSAGAVIVSGYTRSSGWVSGGFDTIHDGVAGARDAFVVKLSSAGIHQWSTYLGGSSTEHGYGVAVTATNDIVVTGYTQSPDWVSGGFDTTLDGTFDAFVVKLSSVGQHVWSTYLGGSGDDRGEEIAINSNGDIFLTGFTNTSGWVSGGFDTSYNGGAYDAYLAKLNSSGNHLWSTYLGGSGDDRGNAIATIGSSAIVVTGNTNSPNWVSGGFDNTYGGNGDPFVARISDTNPSPPALLGDYNRNNTVDAADYALWRKTLGTFNVVPYSGADGNGDGRIGQEDYSVWRAHFGQSFPAAGTASGAAPAVGESFRDSQPLPVGEFLRNSHPATAEKPRAGERGLGRLTPRRDAAAMYDDALIAWLASYRPSDREPSLEFGSRLGGEYDRPASDAAYQSIDAAMESSFPSHRFFQPL